MNYTKVSIPLSESEERALRIAASKSCRRPQDHARFIVLSALGVLDSAENRNPSTVSLPERTANGFAVSQPCSAQAKEVNL